MRLISVKDKNNLFSNNVWSGGEINNTLLLNTEYIVGSAVVASNDVTISDEYKYNGFKSIKVNSRKAGGSWLRFRIPVTEDMINKTITVKAKILIPEGEALAHLLLNATVKSQIRIHATNNEFTEVVLSTVILDGTTIIDFNFGMQDTALIYLDNLTANIQ